MSENKVKPAMQVRIVPATYQEPVKIVIPCSDGDFVIEGREYSLGGRSE